MTDALDRNLPSDAVLAVGGARPTWAHPVSSMARAAAIMAMAGSLLFGVGLLGNELAAWVAPERGFMVAYLAPL